MTKHGQVISYVRPDGESITLHTPPSRSVVNMTGWGYPPVNTHNIQGPFQHGSSILGYRFQERIITLDVIKPGCSRSEWFTERTNLINKLGIQTTNPNLPTLGQLKWEYIENNEYKTRVLDCYLSGGLGFNVDPKWWEFGILESLTFIAPNPIIYDPTAVVTTFDSFDEDLILPMTFPFILGSSTQTQNITYDATWSDFPVIEIDGPTNGVYIENVTTGLYIQLDYAIPNDVTVTIDLTPGSKTITDSDGNNLIRYITASSNLSQFTFEPDPTAAGGVNSIYVAITDPDVDTEIRITYYKRYVGI